MDESVLYRLVLARTFFQVAASNVQRSDPHSLAVAIVNAHDALDNFLGALATHLNVRVAEDLSMLKTYDRIGSESHSLGNRAKLAQLNALRNDVKHQGLHPNPLVVRQLVVETRTFADEVAQAYFGRPLSQIRLVDAITDERVRAKMENVAAMIESTQYREALEQMAYLIYQVYESKNAFSRLLSRVVSPADSDLTRVDFPNFDRTEKRVDFVELGINPEEYEQFHYVVPHVGARGYGDATEYVLKKSRYFWHEGNFNEDICESAFDFLFRFIIARQQRRRKDTFARYHPVDKVTFMRESAVFKRRDGTDVLRAYHAGAEVFVGALAFVDGAWQDYDDEMVFITIYDGTETLFGYLRKADVAVTPDVSLPSGGGEA